MRENEKRVSQDGRFEIEVAPYGNPRNGRSEWRVTILDRTTDQAIDDIFPDRWRAERRADDFLRLIDEAARKREEGDAAEE